METLQRMLRYCLSTEMDRVHLRPGSRPLLDGMGGPREMNFRQLTGEDTSTIAGHFLAEARVGDPAKEASFDGAREIFLLMELPGGGLAEATLEPCRGGMAVSIELMKLLPKHERPEATAV